MPAPSHSPLLLSKWRGMNLGIPVLPLKVLRRQVLLVTFMLCLPFLKVTALKGCSISKKHGSLNILHKIHIKSQKSLSRSVKASDGSTKKLVNTAEPGLLLCIIFHALREQSIGNKPNQRSLSRRRKHGELKPTLRQQRFGPKFSVEGVTSVQS